MKYKVGDRVSVRSDLVVGCSYGGFVFTNEMYQFKGKDFIIVEAKRRCYTLANCDEFGFTESMLTTPTNIVLPRETLKHWEELLAVSGANTKMMVRNDICRYLEE